MLSDWIYYYWWERSLDFDVDIWLNETWSTLNVDFFLFNTANTNLSLLIGLNGRKSKEEKKYCKEKNLDDQPAWKKYSLGNLPSCHFE